MKQFFLIFGFLVIFSIVMQGQDSNSKRISDTAKTTTIQPEILLSINRTTVADGNRENRFGFGIGFYHAIFNQKRCNLIVGLEYNRNSQFMKNPKDHSRWTTNYNTTYTLNYIDLPVSFRVNTGQKIKFFIETGVYIDMYLLGREKGRYKTIQFVFEDSTYHVSEGEFDRKIRRCMVPNFGIQGGLGLRIPIQKHEILLKGDYKWGIISVIRYNDFLYNRYWRFSIGWKANF